jgi:hypothetical protein
MRTFIALCCNGYLLFFISEIKAWQLVRTSSRLLLYVIYVIVAAYPSLLAKLKLFYNMRTINKYNLIFSSFLYLYLISLCLKSLYLTSLTFLYLISF